MMRPYTLFVLASAFAMLNAAAEEPRTYQLDPFAQATDGYGTKQPLQENRVRLDFRA
jgi:hypothetical protein